LPKIFLVSSRVILSWLAASCPSVAVANSCLDYYYFNKIQFNLLSCCP
jgi:hypothetical protein